MVDDRLTCCRVEVLQASWRLPRRLGIEALELRRRHLNVVFRVIILALVSQRVVRLFELALLYIREGHFFLRQGQIMGEVIAPVAADV